MVRASPGLVGERGSGQGIAGHRPQTKPRRDVRAALLGRGLDSEESPLRLAESGPVVLSPKSMKGILREGSERSGGWGKKLCIVHLGEVRPHKTKVIGIERPRISDWLSGRALPSLVMGILFKAFLEGEKLE